MFSLNGRFRATAIAGLIAAGAFAAPAHAHEAGDVLFRVGVTQVRPSQNNGTVLDGAVKLDVNNNVRPSFTLAYMATRNIGIELLGAWPFQHDVSGSGGLGKIGSTKHLPPTLSLQWHILPDSMIQPYIGVGINYTHFFDTKAEGPLKGSNLKLDDSWGVAAQLGADIKINDRWFMNADIRYIDIKSTVKLDGERIGTARIDPWVATLGVGYRF